MTGSLCVCSGYEQIPCQVAGYVPCGDGPDEFSRRRFIPKSQDRGVSMAAAYALAAAEEALTSARWKPEDKLGLERTGTAEYIALCYELMHYPTDCAGEENLS